MDKKQAAVRGGIVGVGLKLCLPLLMNALKVLESLFILKYIFELDDDDGI